MTLNGFVADPRYLCWASCSQLR